MTDAPPEQAWFAKADEDLEIARRALGPDQPLPAMACYHAQQCAEKPLKGYLVAHDVPFRLVHDLGYLISTLHGTGQSGLRRPKAQLAVTLNPYVATARYPSEAAQEPDIEAAGAGYSTSRTDCCRSPCRHSLPPHPHPARIGPFVHAINFATSPPAIGVSLSNPRSTPLDFGGSSQRITTGDAGHRVGHRHLRLIASTAPTPPTSSTPSPSSAAKTKPSSTAATAPSDLILYMNALAAGGVWRQTATSA